MDLEIEKIRFEEFIKNNGVIHRKNGPSSTFDTRDSYFWHWKSWNLEDLENRFWNYIDYHNGFSKCPTCNSKPKINRMGKLMWNFREEEGLFKETLDYPSYGEPCRGFLPIKTINCCEWLYEFDTQKKYILSEKVKYITREKIKFNTIKSRRNEHRMINELRYGQENEKYYWDEYTEYNPNDPTGEKDLREKEIFDTQDKIRLLKEQLASEESKLSSL
jgi:hypothetical protein